jgi:hypothetical protein
LGEGRDSGTKSIFHGENNVLVCLNGNKGTFMEVNGEPIVKDPLKVRDMLRDNPNDNKGVVCILEDGTEGVIHKRVKKEA